MGTAKPCYLLFSFWASCKVIQHLCLSPDMRLEPMTLRLKVWCSTDWGNRAAHSIIFIFNAKTLCKLMTCSCPLYKLKDNSNDQHKNNKHGEQSSASGTSCPGSFAPRDRGKRDPWNELARTGQARFCVIEKQSKFSCKWFWRKSVLFWFSSHCSYSMICCFVSDFRRKYRPPFYRLSLHQWS